jgi:hypothetical protein
MTCTDGTVNEPAHDAGDGRLVATVTEIEIDALPQERAARPRGRPRQQMETR